MRRSVKYYVFGILVLAMISCGKRQPRFSCFYDAAQDSVYLDLHDYVLPASRVSLYSAIKVGDKYYLKITEEDFPYRGSLVEISEMGHESHVVPFPDALSTYCSVSTRNDTLVILDNDNSESFYYSKSGKWAKAKTLARPSYEDDEYIVQYEEHGEFGDAMWFIDKYSEKEYAFVGLSGRVCRLGGVFYIVKPTRIYEVPEPSVGFHCDSLTNYAVAKKIHLLGHHFWEAGYCNDDHNIRAIVHFDNEPAGMEERVAPNGVSYYEGGFWVSEYAKADTTIIGSFIESDTLYCALHTPSGLELAKLDQRRLVPVHKFNLDLGSNSLRYRRISDYPTCVTSRYIVSDDPLDEGLLILVNRREGLSELIDMSKDGNSFVNIVYEQGGLNTIDSDGFETILPFYLDNWGHIPFEDVLRQEYLLGGKISHADRWPVPNHPSDDKKIPSVAIYHVKFSKIVRNDYSVTTAYSIQESDRSITAVSMDWNINDYTSAACWQKFDELSETISGRLGPGTSVAKANGKMQYMEWSSETCTLRLSVGHNNVRLIIF